MSFLRTVSSLRRGDHACLVYDRVERRDELLLEFLRAGIVSGDRAVYVAEGADPRTVAELTALAGSGRLEVASPTDTYLDGGEFDADRVLESIRATRDASLSERHSALRIGGGPPAALTRNPQAHLLSRYERRANELFEQGAMAAICAYDVRTTDPASLLAIVEAHSIVLYAVGPDPRLRIEPAGAGRLKLAGWLDLTTIGSLVGPLSTAIRAGNDVELDFSAVDFVDVAGLRLFAEAADALHERGAELRLLSLPDWVPKVVRMLGYDGREGLVMR